MKILWLCNMIPGKIREAMGGSAGGGLWVDHVLEDLLHQPDLQLRVCCPGPEQREGTLSSGLSYRLFTEGLPYHYLPELEESFCRDLREFQPDVIHIWGTEYGHTLAMVNAARAISVEKRVVISIQGLCSVYAGHYTEGIPARVRYGFSFRDLIQRDNLYFQTRKYARRGQLECKALEGVCHVIGRTDWDNICTHRINPALAYHFCNETLRSPFYSGAWQYDSCKKHRIFASAYYSPVKGLHYLLEAFGEVVKRYPDATLTVTGDSFLRKDWKSRLRRQSYHRYLAGLARKYGVEDRIEFLGGLNAEQMKQAFLDANVFVLPSTIENSPNSLGEAMLLGVPSVAADVGGVSGLMRHGQEGYVYQSGAAYMLCGYICRIFDMGVEAEALGQAAASHARVTHDPEKNLADLLIAYREVAEG